MRKFHHALSLALEDNINGIDFKLIETNDPAVALSGGAFTFTSSKYTLRNAQRFLEEIDEETKAKTNNPTLVKEIEDFSTTSPETSVIVFSNELKKTLTAQEYKAVIYHELGHIRHGHTAIQSKAHEHGQMTFQLFMKHEKEADAYAAKHFGPEVMITGLEKALRFGAEFGVSNLKESNDAIKHLLDIGVLNEISVRFIYYAGKLMHGQRFKALEHWKKYNKQENE